jgi:hypothetical protein
MTTVQGIPEQATLALFVFDLVGVAASIRRRP